MSTSKAFYRLLISLQPELGLPKGFSVIYPYSNPEVKKVLRAFCDKYYAKENERVLMLGINPGRFGAGITGIPFTDPYALKTFCGIDNGFESRQELSSTFIHELIETMGGPKLFYQKVLLSSVCPLGFLNGTKNCNYYDSPALIKKSDEFIQESLKLHLKLNVSREKVIVLGKKNALFLQRFESFSSQFKEIIVLDHPRFVMQYRSKSKLDYIHQYINAI